LENLQKTILKHFGRHGTNGLPTQCYNINIIAIFSKTFKINAGIAGFTGGARRIPVADVQSLNRWNRGHSAAYLIARIKPRQSSTTTTGGGLFIKKQ
jgi:hypothetical protein